MHKEISVTNFFFCQNVLKFPPAFFVVVVVFHTTSFLFAEWKLKCSLLSKVLGSLMISGISFQSISCNVNVNGLLQ